MNLRARAALFFGVLALGKRVFDPPPAVQSVEGLVVALERATGGVVRREDVAWEPSPGILTEILAGRRILFLSRPREGGARDLFRARVRLTLEGRPVAVSAVHNLTGTPLGDEQELVALGPRAAFATASYGKVESVTLLDLKSKPAVASPSIFDGFMSAISNLQETGTSAGVGRVDVSLDAPCDAIALGFSPTGDVLSIADGRGKSMRLEVATGALRVDRSALGGRASTPPSLPKRPVLWAVDTVRAELGPEPVARVEEAVFALRDWAKRAGYRALGGRRELDVEPQAVPAVRALGAEPGAVDTGTWPPPPIRSMWKNLEPGEAGWEPITYPWLKRLGGASGPELAASRDRRGAEPPPYFYKTTVRPDRERPYVKVLVVAMDMRQLELDMEGGVEDPKPLTGVRGAGKIPRDPKILGRVVGAFNGAFKTTHGEYGMMVDRRVLLPPKPAAATLVVTRDHGVGLGNWGTSTAIPDDLLSFRQNLEPLVEDGRLSPSGRTQWGYQLTGTSMFTERTGVCLSAAGQLYYFWGDELSGATLGKAMLQAGCTYGMHLDMNPHHTGFVFASVRSYANRDYDAKLLTPAMEIMAERYLEWSPKDFFYIMLREVGPGGDLAWAPDPGTQPAPTWLTSVLRADAKGRGGGSSKSDVELVAFDARRLGFRIQTAVRQRRAATREADAGEDRDFLSTELPEEDARRVIASIGLGNPPKEARGPGAGTGGGGAGAGGAPSAMAYVAADEKTGLFIGSSAELEAKGAASAIALPWLFEDGKLAPAARDRSPRRRGALCVTPTGYVVVALATADTDDALAEPLLGLGCTRGVALDRGSHRSAFVHRAGGASPPLSHYDETALYALGVPMPARAFRWRP
jgi:hypothetical protein